MIIPTTIDTRHYHNPGLSQSEKNPHRVCIGWTGSHSTLKYLKALEPVLQRLAETRPSVDFIFTADLDPSLDLPRTTFIPWHLSNEISTLMKLDIGIMPLPDDPWTQGKGGFKALQYLALEIPAVVSPVGINQEIITDAVNGYLASTGEEWLDALTRLVDDKTHRVQLGQAGRKGVEAHYSVDAVAPLFLKLFE